MVDVGGGELRGVGGEEGVEAVVPPRKEHLHRLPETRAPHGGTHLHPHPLDRMGNSCLEFRVGYARLVHVGGARVEKGGVGPVGRRVLEQVGAPVDFHGEGPAVGVAPGLVRAGGIVGVDQPPDAVFDIAVVENVAARARGVCAATPARSRGRAGGGVGVFSKGHTFHGVSVGHVDVPVRGVVHDRIRRREGPEQQVDVAGLGAVLHDAALVVARVGHEQVAHGVDEGLRGLVQPRQARQTVVAGGAWQKRRGD